MSTQGSAQSVVGAQNLAAKGSGMPSTPSASIPVPERIRSAPSVSEGSNASPIAYPAGAFLPYKMSGSPNANSFLPFKLGEGPLPPLSELNVPGAVSSSPNAQQQRPPSGGSTMLPGVVQQSIPLPMGSPSSRPALNTPGSVLSASPPAFNPMAMYGYQGPPMPRMYPPGLVLPSAPFVPRNAMFLGQSPPTPSTIPAGVPQVITPASSATVSTAIQTSSLPKKSHAMQIIDPATGQAIDFEQRRRDLEKQKEIQEKQREAEKEQKEKKSLETKELIASQMRERAKQLSDKEKDSLDVAKSASPRPEPQFAAASAGKSPSENSVAEKPSEKQNSTVSSSQVSPVSKVSIAEALDPVEHIVATANTEKEKGDAGPLSAKAAHKSEKEKKDLALDWESAEESVLVENVLRHDNSTQTGRKLYSKDFLLQFQPRYTVRPAGLQLLNELLPDAEADSKLSRSGRGKDDRGGRRGGGGGFKDTRESKEKDRSDKKDDQSWRDKKKPEQPQLSGVGNTKGSKRGRKDKEAKNTLHATEGRWERPGAAKDAQDATLREIHRLLNKLTMDNIARVGPKLLKLELSRLEVLQLLIDGIFQKAIDEPNFTSLYVVLCVELAQRVTPVLSSEGSSLDFRRVLLQRCQLAFENRTHPPRLSSTMTAEQRAEVDLQALKVRARNVGNVKFIGSLYRKGMLSANTIHRILAALLGPPERFVAYAGLTTHEREDVDEDVEHFAVLLSLTGKRLEAETLAGSKEMLQLYLARITPLAQVTSPLPSRLKFALQELLDLRSRGWKNRKGKDVDAQDRPKTIEEVHADEALKQREKEAAAQRIRSGKSSWDDRAVTIAKRPEQSKTSPDGWREVGGFVPSPASSSGPSELAGRGRVSGKISLKTTEETPPSPSMGRGRGDSRKSATVNEALNRYNLLQSSGEVSSPESARRPPTELVSDEESDSDDHSIAGFADAENDSENDIREVDAKLSAASTPLNPDDVPRKVELLLEEYFESEEDDVAIECFREFLPSLTATALDSLFLKAAEIPRPRDRALVASLLSQLVESGMVTRADLLSGAARFTRALDELALDSPKAPDQAAHVFGLLWRNDTSALQDVLEYLKKDSSPAITRRAFVNLLRVLIESSSKETARSLWTSQNIVGESEQTSFILQNAFELLDDGAALSEVLKDSWSNASTHGVEGLSHTLRTFGNTDISQLQRISKLLCEFAAKDDRFDLLASLKVLATVLPQQVRVLIGAHEAWHSLGEVKGDLQRSFDALYSTKVVHRKAVERWLEDKSEDVPDKGEALFEINPWWTKKLQEEKDAAKASRDREKNTQS